MVMLPMTDSKGLSAGVQSNRLDPRPQRTNERITSHSPSAELLVQAEIILFHYITTALSPWLWLVQRPEYDQRFRPGRCQKRHL